MVQISDAALKELNGEEIAIYALLKAPDQVLNRTHLQNKSEFSRERLSKVLNSLERKGFVEFMQGKNEKGQFSVIYFDILK